MNFSTTEFGVFLVTVVAVFWGLRQRWTLSRWFLLAASYYFYSCWNAKYLVLIVGSTLLDYWVGGRMAKLDVSEVARRRLLLLLSLIGNLGTLAVFKYYGFFRENMVQLLGADLPALDVLLPVGISFYTFQSLSYTIDIYWGKIRPARSLSEFALFVAFFPQLVAGPIVRARDFLPQLVQPRTVTREDLQSGLYRILEGLGKKIVIADVLAVHLVDPVFCAGSTLEGPVVLLGIYGYALQIYGDFAGYSDIAIGTARILGFRIPENFDAPYRATSITDFWRRWHISLSTWLRDYLYVPLGGNRNGAWKTYRNLMLTMLLGGLWHGSQWNFVFWGGLHGLWLGVNRWWNRRFGSALPGLPGKVLAILLTFHLVCLAWVFFRAQDLSAALDVLRRLPGSDWPAWQPSVVLAFVLGFGTHFLPDRWKRGVRHGFVELPPVVAGAAASVCLGVFAYSKVVGVPFIYFQF